jgi:hypothetical protein
MMIITLHKHKHRHSVQVVTFLHISVPHRTQSQYTLYRHCSTPSSPSYSCQWLTDGYPTPVHVFFHSAQFRTLICSLRNVVFLWLRRNLVYLASRTDFCRAPGQGPLKLTKPIMGSVHTSLIMLSGSTLILSYHLCLCSPNIFVLFDFRLHIYIHSRSHLFAACPTTS